MTSSAHRAIAIAVAEQLKASGVAMGRVYRGRTRAISAESPHGVVVRLLRSASERAAQLGGRTDWNTLVQVECYGRNVGGEPDEVADSTAVAVFESLGSDPTLGGLAYDLAPLDGATLDWDFDELDSNLACVTAKFVVKHQTLEGKLTT